MRIVRVILVQDNGDDEELGMLRANEDDVIENSDLSRLIYAHSGLICGGDLIMLRMELEDGEN